MIYSIWNNYLESLICFSISTFRKHNIVVQIRELSIRNWQGEYDNRKSGLGGKSCRISREKNLVGIKNIVQQQVE